MIIKIKRLLAIYIDFFITIACSLLITNTLTLFKLNIYSSAKFIIVFGILYFIFFMFLIIFKDFFSGRSIGKKIFKLFIVDNSGKIIIDKTKLLKRNLASLVLFPIYPFMIIINNKSYGDYKNNCIIIEKKNLNLK